MLSLSNCKINLGLFITGKRPDGFHDLASVFYPVGWNDAIEIELNIGTKNKIELIEYNNSVTTNPAQNLCVKAYNLLDAQFNLPAIKLHLFKTIPAGAGLGGGSSNASHTLKLLNTFFDLKISNADLKTFAAHLGSDCPFFIDNKPAYITGRGEIIKPIDLDLSSYSILLINPNIHISTAQAFSKITPTPIDFDLSKKILETKPNEWKGFLNNDFEPSAIESHPLIGEIKNNMYSSGALYASMSGSGSTVFGIFNPGQNINSLIEKYRSYNTKLILNQDHLQYL